MKSLLVGAALSVVLFSCTSIVGDKNASHPGTIVVDGNLEVTNWHAVLEHNCTSRRYVRDKRRFVELYREAQSLERSLEQVSLDFGSNIRSGSSDVSLYRTNDKWLNWSYTRRVLSELLLRKSRFANCRRKLESDKTRAMASRLVETLALLIYQEIDEMLETEHGRVELQDLMGLDGAVAEYVYEKIHGVPS